MIFLPLLWVATLYFHGWIPAAFGLVWCLGRVVYAFGYMQRSRQARPGFRHRRAGDDGAVDLSIWGVAVSWMAATAT